MKKCEGTSAFSEENPRDRRKKPAGDGEGTCPTEPWSENSPWYSVEAGTWRMMIVERLPDSRQGGKLLEARYSQLKLFQVHGR
jgi:hypothetical protein